MGRWGSRELPGGIVKEVNGERCNAVGDSGNTASHVFAVHFDFAGVAVSYHAACGDGDVGPRCHGEEGFTGSGGGGEVVGEELDGELHGDGG